jgi:hypothetical protein
MIFKSLYFFLIVAGFSSSILGKMGGLNYFLNSPSSIISVFQPLEFGFGASTVLSGETIETSKDLYLFQNIWHNLEIGASVNDQSSYTMHIQAMIFNKQLGGHGHYVGIGSENIGWTALDNDISRTVIGPFVNYTYRSGITLTNYNIGLTKNLTSDDATLFFSLEQTLFIGTFIWGWDGTSDNIGISVNLFGVPTFASVKVYDVDEGTTYLGTFGLKFEHDNIVSRLIGKLLGQPQPYKPSKPSMPEYEGVNEKIRKSLDTAMKEGYEYYYQGDLKKALSEYKHISMEYPNSSLVFERLGTIYYQLDNKRDALKSWRKSLELEPNNEELIKFVTSVEVELESD